MREPCLVPWAEIRPRPHDPMGFGEEEAGVARDVDERQFDMLVEAHVSWFPARHGEDDRVVGGVDAQDDLVGFDIPFREELPVPGAADVDGFRGKSRHGYGAIEVVDPGVDLGRIIDLAEQMDGSVRGDVHAGVHVVWGRSVIRVSSIPEVSS